MLVFVIADAISIFLGIVLSFLPVVHTLPVVFGYDIDSALVLGFGEMRDVVSYVWPLQIMLQGALALFAYYAIKIGVRIFLGSRTPTND